MLAGDLDELFELSSAFSSAAAVPFHLSNIVGGSIGILLPVGGDGPDARGLQCLLDAGQSVDLAAASLLAVGTGT